MTPLRQRYIEDMQLRGLSASTQEVYVNAVRRLAAYYGKSPDNLSDEELRQCFLYLKNDKQVASGTYKVAISSLKFLYEQTLKRSWLTLALIRAPKRRNCRSSSAAALQQLALDPRFVGGQEASNYFQTKFL